MAKWIIDTDHTVAHFSVRHMMINDVHGQFNKIAGFVNFDPSDITATSMEIEIDVASIFTGVEPIFSMWKNIPIFFSRVLK